MRCPKGLRSMGFNDNPPNKGALQEGSGALSALRVICRLQITGRIQLNRSGDRSKITGLLSTSMQGHDNLQNTTVKHGRSKTLHRYRFFPSSLFFFVWRWTIKYLISYHSTEQDVEITSQYFVPKNSLLRSSLLLLIVCFSYAPFCQEIKSP